MIALVMIPLLMTVASLAQPLPNKASVPLPGNSDPGWPRVVSTDGHNLLYYQPQAEEWVGSKAVKGKSAFALTPRGQKESFYGAATIQADTQTDLDARTVFVYNIHLETVAFSVPEGRSKEPLITLVKALFPKSAVTISLDRLLASLNISEQKTRETKVSIEPPKIIYSSSPAVLVMTDGKAVLVDIEKTGLQYVINTNWDLLFVNAGQQYYLLNKDMWLTSKAMQGPWTVAGKLPAGFSQIPNTDNWTEVRKNVPPRLVPGAKAPKVFTSEEPAELDPYHPRSGSATFPRYSPGLRLQHRERSLLFVRG